MGRHEHIVAQSITAFENSDGQAHFVLTNFLYGLHMSHRVAEGPEARVDVYMAFAGANRRDGRAWGLWNGIPSLFFWQAILLLN